MVQDYRDLFPSGCTWKVGLPSGEPADLFPSEQTEIARAVDKRRREFAAGRTMARSLLSELGLAPAPIAVGSNRAPQWPRGIVGSISHCDDLCFVVVARASAVMSIGVDVEPALALPPDVASLTVSSAERLELSTLRDVDTAVAERVVFSAKESVHKCLSPLLGLSLEFTDLNLELRLDLQDDGEHACHRGRFVARPTARGAHAGALEALQGRFGIDGAHITTSAVIHHSDGSGAASTA